MEKARPGYSVGDLRVRPLRKARKSAKRRLLLVQKPRYVVLH